VALKTLQQNPSCVALGTLPEIPLGRWKRAVGIVIVHTGWTIGTTSAGGTLLIGCKEFYPLCQVGLRRENEILCQRFGPDSKGKRYNPWQTGSSGRGRGRHNGQATGKGETRGNSGSEILLTPK
jgi:hypothetical protein